MSRRAAAVAGVVSIVVTVALSALGAARATTQPGMTGRPNESVTQEFPPIPATLPAALGAAEEPNPARCATLPSCDVVPLTVEQPESLSIFDDFYVDVELRWDRLATPGVDNDLDLYLWLDPQSTGSLARSVTAEEPERLRFAQPTGGKYSIVVVNASGRNTGYTVVVHVIHTAGERPPELDVPSAGPSRSPSGGAIVGSADGPSSSGGAASSSPSAVSPGGAPSVGEPGLPAVIPAAVAPTPELATLQRLDPSQLAASAAGGDLFRTAGGPPAAPRPVSGAVVALWGGLVPAATGVGALVVMRRRRPAVLAVRAARA